VESAAARSRRPFGRLEVASPRIEKAERSSAELVRDLGKGGYAAVARELGVTPEADRKRLRRILGE
jgi:hypothetical protein